MSDSKNEIRKGFYYPTETYYFYITLISIYFIVDSCNSSSKDISHTTPTVLVASGTFLKRK
jgi:hypothetical protein